MTKSVVDGLEMIEVEHEQRDVLRRLRKKVRSTFQKSAPSQNARQEIRRRHVALLHGFVVELQCRERQRHDDVDDHSLQKADRSPRILVDCRQKQSNPHGRADEGGQAQEE